MLAFHGCKIGRNPERDCRYAQVASQYLAFPVFVLRRIQQLCRISNILILGVCKLTERVDAEPINILRLA